MSAIEIDYGNLVDTSEYLKKMIDKTTTYSDEISDKVTKRIEKFPGNDDMGYAANAAESASKKISLLTEKAERYSNLKKQIDFFNENTKKADETVANSIKNQATPYIGERSAWQGFCDFLWNAVCVDIMNSNFITRGISDIAGHIWTGIKSVAEKVCDWFKYGGGQYLWDILSNTVTAILAIVGIIGGIVALGAASITVVGIVVAAAAIIGGIITLINSAIDYGHTFKAMSEEDPAKAQYARSINNIYDVTQKYDFGGKFGNGVATFVGVGATIVEVLCDLVDFADGASNLFKVTTSTGTTFKFDLPTIKNNVKTMSREAIGYDANTNKYTFSNFFKFNKADDTSNWFINQSAGTASTGNVLNRFGRATNNYLAGLSPTKQKWITGIADGAKYTERYFINPVNGAVEASQYDSDSSNAGMKTFGKLALTFSGVFTNSINGGKLIDPTRWKP